MTWKPKWVLTVFLALGIVGCSSGKMAKQLKQASLMKTLGTEGKSQILQPKRCVLTVAMLSRPMRDPALNQAIWSVADEEAIGSDARRVLASNGIRIGVITGELPSEVEAVLKAPPPHKVDPAKIIQPDGEPTLISVSTAVPQASLLIKQNDQVLGKDFADASGYFRITPQHDGTAAVSLRIVPEIHHGPIQKTFGTVATPGLYAPQEFTMKSGQQEDALRDLAATLTLQPNQAVVFGCDPDRRESLGTFLFTHPEPNSDRLMQKVVLIWAARSQSGNLDDAPALGTKPGVESRK